MLSKYIPKHFTELYESIGRKGYVRVEGTVMFADLSGFTQLSEKLTAKGKEGSEEISRIINEIFEDLISVVSIGGGSVYKFGGDAITVFFPASVKREYVLQTAVEMQNVITKFEKIKTIAGECSVRMKIGLAYGESIIGMLGEKNKQYFIAGNTLDTACECEHHAVQGEIIISDKMKDAAGKCKKRDKFFELDIKGFSEREKIKKSRENKSIQKEYEWYRDFIDSELIEREEASSLEKGELRNCSVIFLNFTGIEYNESFDYKLLNDFYSLTAAAVKKYQGFINKIDMGDKGNKIIALFGAPVSTEKNEEYALRAIQEIRMNRPESIDMKAGVNNGNIYFGVVGAAERREFTVIGNTVNLSARLMASAGINEVIISSKIKEKVTEIETGNERQLKLKGVAGLFSAYDFKAMIETEKHKKIKLIGRKKEQEEYWDTVKKRKALLISIKAEAGLGKSVLVSKLFEERNKNANCYLVNCLSYTKDNPYYAVKEFIAKFAGVSFLDPNSIKIKKLKILMKSLGEEKNAELYASFLSWSDSITDLSDPGLKDFFTGVSLSIFNKIISIDKSVLFLEDSHWIDSSSADFFHDLLNIYDPGSNPGCINFIFRPDGIMKRFEENKNSYTIDLNNLEYDEGKEFIIKKFSLANIPGKIYEQIHQKTKGNPFFMEEILIALKNEGNLIEAKSDQAELKYKIKPSIKSIKIPDNVNDIVLSRIDKLDENSKTILKIASVIGRIFQFDILKQLQNLKEIASQLDIRDSLFDLTKVDLTIFEETSENEYLFKHAITQEVAYETLLYSLRRKYHLKIAQLYERNYRDNISSAYELLAFHYRNTLDKEKAKYYLLRSAGSAKNKFSYKEAFNYLRLFRKYKMTQKEKLESYFIDIEMLKVMEKRKEAVILTEKIMNATDPGSEVYQRALVKKANILRRSADYKNALAEFEKIRYFTSEDIELEGLVDAAFSYLYLGEKERLTSVIPRLELLSERTKDVRLKVWTLNVFALKAFKQREFKEAIGFSEKMMRLSHTANLVHEKSSALLTIASSSGQMGEIDKAAKVYEEVFLEAKRNHNYLLLMRSIDGLSKVSYLKGNFKKSEKYICEGIKLVDKTSKIELKESLLQSLSNIRLETKKYDEVLELCKKREEILIKTGNRLRISELNDNKGDVYFYKKEYDKAIQIYKANLKFSEEINNIEMVGHSYGNLANCYAETGKLEESLKYYNLQIEYSRKHNDIHSEGKALYNLAYTYFDNFKDIIKSEEHALKAKKIFEKIGFKHGLDSVNDLLKSIEENKAEK